MRTRVARVIVIVLTLLIGVALVRELFFYFRPSRELGVYLVKPVGRIFLRKFKPLAHACGGKYNSYSTSYEAPDGAKTSESGATFSSPSEAKRRLQERLKDATGILER